MLLCTLVPSSPIDRFWSSVDINIFSFFLSHTHISWNLPWFWFENIVTKISSPNSHPFVVLILNTSLMDCSQIRFPRLQHHLYQAICQMICPEGGCFLGHCCAGCRVHRDHGRSLSSCQDRRLIHSHRGCARAQSLCHLTRVGEGNEIFVPIHNPSHLKFGKCPQSTKEY